MALEPDTGSRPEEPVQNLRLSWIGLVTKTIDLWVKRLPKYIGMFLLPAALVVLLNLAVLYVLLGSVALTWLAFISNNLVTTIVNLLLSTEALPLPAVVWIGLSVIDMVVYTLAAGAAVKFTLDGYVSSQPGNLKSSFSFAFNRLSVLIGVQLGFGLIMALIALPLLIWVSQLLLSFDPENPYSIDLNLVLLVFVLILVLGPIMLYVSVRFTPLIAVPIAEEHGIVDSFKRAWALTRGSFWHIFGAQFILAIVIQIITFALGFVSMALVYVSEWISIPVMSALTVIIIGPLDYVFLAVLVKDLQSRVEVRKQQYW